MGSLVKLYTHIIFSTKNREPLIKSPIDKELFNILGGICRTVDCNPIIVGGHLDHVHILCMLGNKISISSLVEEIKTVSSKWMKRKDRALKNFYWQGGYAAFSVSESMISRVKEYINNQETHHMKMGFKEELIGFLQKHNVQYDEKYL